VPFLSNAALYMLLGSPPDPMPDGVVTDGMIPNSYYPVVDGCYFDADAHIVSNKLTTPERLPVPDEAISQELPMDEDLREALDAYQEGARGPRALERELKCSYYQAKKLWDELVAQGLVES
jgi:hypothetical protein